MAVALLPVMTAHHFTIDVEEYFQVSALESHVPRADWDYYESRVLRQVDLLLSLLALNSARATCFVLGWVALRQPDLIRAIARAGHEIASHGWDHVRVTQQTPAQFRDSVRRSKDLLEQITGAPVVGFRAPSFSIVPGKEWALDILVEEGYRYDSSLFPATLQLGPLRLPAAGGAYFRLLPYGLARAALRQCERRGVPGTFYIHTWEVDPVQPRLPVSSATRVRHYGGLRKTLTRLERLLGEFRFGPIRETVVALPTTLQTCSAAMVPIRERLA